MLRSPVQNTDGDEETPQRKFKVPPVPQDFGTISSASSKSSGATSSSSKIEPMSESSAGDSSDGLVAHQNYDHSGDDGVNNTVTLANAANASSAPAGKGLNSVAQIAAMLITKQATSAEEAIAKMAPDTSTQDSPSSQPESSESTVSVISPVPAPVAAKGPPPRPKDRYHPAKATAITEESTAAKTDEKSPGGKKRGFRDAEDADSPKQGDVSENSASGQHTGTSDYDNAVAKLNAAAAYTAYPREGAQFDSDDSAAKQKPKGKKNSSWHLPSFKFSHKPKPKPDDSEDDSPTDDHAAEQKQQPPVLAKPTAPASLAHAPASGFHHKLPPPSGGRGHSRVPSANPTGHSTAPIPPPPPPPRPGQPQ